MVLFHYALVDDLISKEEFERRVEQKIDECGDLIDEPTAAMLVVGALGRQHVKVRDLSGKSSLFCFFARVLDKTDPKEFDRKDGEKGWVATLLVGDETGITRVVLWDEKAGAALEIAVGDVLEVIGRHPGKNTREIYALALRKATCEITCAVNNGGAALSTEPVDLDGVLIGAGAPRTFTRRDGTTGEMTECIIGDAGGTARLVVWAPGLLRNIPGGSTVHITGAKPDRRAEGRSYSIDDTGSIQISTTPVTVPFSALAAVASPGFFSVQGEVKTVQEPRSFTSRDGIASWVRNIRIVDGESSLNVVLWGEKALMPVHQGDHIVVYHGVAKPGRFGGHELSVGRGSVVLLPEEKPRHITIVGTIIPGSGGMFVDDGSERYLVADDISAGSRVRITGMLCGNRISPESVEPAETELGQVTGRLAALAARLDIR